MQDIVRAAAVAVDTKPGEVDSNLDKIATWAERVSAEGVNLVLFQELSLTGFIPNHPVGNHDRWLRTALRAGADMAIRLDGHEIGKLSEIAEKNDLLLSAGILEDAGNCLHNTHVLVDRNGLLGYWRKMHIPMYEMPFYNGGNAPRVVDTSLGRIGGNICFDTLLPESTRLLAIQNAEIVLFPFAADPPPVTPQGWAEWAGLPLRSRCIENAVYGVACNYVGHVECAGATQDFPGGGMVVDPWGRIVSDWKSPPGEPGMIIADLSAESLREARSEPEYLFRFRRPELYGRLTDNRNMD